MTTRPWWSEPPSARWVACCCSLRSSSPSCGTRRRSCADARPHASQPRPRTRARARTGRTPCPRGGARWAAARQAVWRAPRLRGARSESVSSARCPLLSPIACECAQAKSGPGKAQEGQGRSAHKGCAERKRGRGGVHPARQGVGWPRPAPGVRGRRKLFGAARWRHRPQRGEVGAQALSAGECLGRECSIVNHEGSRRLVGPRNDECLPLMTHTRRSFLVLPSLVYFERCMCTLCIPWCTTSYTERR